MGEEAKVEAKCAHCGVELTPEHMGPCPSCGKEGKNNSLTIHDDLVPHDFVDLKKKSPEYKGKKKLRVHLQQGDQFNHGTGKFVKKKWFFDKDKSPHLYFKDIVDSETGKVLHHVEKPLGDHKGHGSARKKTKDG